MKEVRYQDEDDSGLVKDKALASNNAEAGIIAPENGDKAGASAPESADCGQAFTFAGEGDEVFFVSESEDKGAAFTLESRTGNELATCESAENDYPIVTRERRDEASAFTAGSGDGDLWASPEEGAGDRPKRARFLGVRLRKGGQVFFFPDEQLLVRTGSKVIVECEQGSAFGEVESIFFTDVSASSGDEGQQPPGRILGLATAQDIALHAENRILGDEATAFCTTCIRQRFLDMKLVDVEVLHDRSKIIFYFTAPTRIDFRDLVKDLVRNYRTRIELRQIGVRHETQMIGGIGNFGMVCCCHQYLRKFAPVTIKMAKEQSLFLNPTKLSGMCGRLLCCLSFEQSNYEEFNRRCPKLGKRYVTTSGTFRIMRVNIFPRSIVVCSDAGEEKELTLEEWENITPRRVEHPASNTRNGFQSRRSPGEVGGRDRSREKEPPSGD